MGGLINPVHFPGIIQAIIHLIALGFVVTYAFSSFQYELKHDWLPHDPHGYMPGTIERSVYSDEPRVGGMYPEVVGGVTAILEFLVAYFALGGWYLLGVFVGELFWGYSPPDFPMLYYIGGIAFLWGIARMYIVTNDMQTSKRTTGHRGF